MGGGCPPKPLFEDNSPLSPLIIIVDRSLQMLSSFCDFLSQLVLYFYNEKYVSTSYSILPQVDFTFDLLDITL